MLIFRYEFLIPTLSFFPIHRIMDFRDIINTHDNESVQVLVGLTIGSCLTSRKSISVGKLKCVSGGLSFDISYLKRIHEFLSPFLYFSPIVECVLSLEKSYRSIYHLRFNSFEWKRILNFTRSKERRVYLFYFTLI